MLPLKKRNHRDPPLSDIDNKKRRKGIGSLPFSNPATCSSSPKKKGGKSKRRNKKKCEFCGCKNNTSTPNVTFHRIQGIVNPPDDLTNESKMATYHALRKKRQQQLRACGLKINDPRKDIRVCSEHDGIWKKVSQTYTHLTKEGETKTQHQSFKVHCPNPEGVKNRPLTDCKGRGSDRAAANVLKETSEKEKCKNDPTASWILNTQQTFEQNTPCKKWRMNPDVQTLCGLTFEEDNQSKFNNREAV